MAAGKIATAASRDELKLRELKRMQAIATGLGQPVVTDGYGKPSKYERNVQRRQSPGLTQTAQASVSFAPLISSCSEISSTEQISGIIVMSG